MNSYETLLIVFYLPGVILLSALANRFRLHKLSRVDQFVMSYGGLRGAVAFALVLLIDENLVPQKNMFVTTTIAVIYFTVFLQGITIKPLVKILNVKRASKRKPTMNERIHERVSLSKFVLFSKSCLVLEFSIDNVFYFLFPKLFTVYGSFNGWH